jgi:hypothetical protein
LSEDGLLKHIVAKRGSVDKEESEEHHAVELPNSGYGSATAAVAEAGDLFAVSLAGLGTLLAGNNERAIAAKPPKKQKKRKAEEDRLTQYTFSVCIPLSLRFLDIRSPLPQHHFISNINPL